MAEPGRWVEHGVMGHQLHLLIVLHGGVHLACHHRHGLVLLLLRRLVLLIATGDDDLRLRR